MSIRGIIAAHDRPIAPLLELSVSYCATVAIAFLGVLVAASLF